MPLDPRLFEMPPDTELDELQRRARVNSWELLAALRKVTANLRGACADLASEFDGSVEEGLERLAEAGVLEAEALLKRIDEKGGR